MRWESWIPDSELQTKEHVLADLKLPLLFLEHLLSLKAQAGGRKIYNFKSNGQLEEKESIGISFF